MAIRPAPHFVVSRQYIHRHRNIIVIIVIIIIIIIIR